MIWLIIWRSGADPWVRHKRGSESGIHLQTHEPDDRVRARVGHSLSASTNATTSRRHSHQPRAERGHSTCASSHSASTTAATSHARAARDSRMPTGTTVSNWQEDNHHIGQAVAASSTKSHHRTSRYISALAYIVSIFKNHIDFLKITNFPAPLPQKPQAVLIERWLPYTEVKRRVVLNRPTEPDPVVIKPHNVIVQWDAPQVSFDNC